MRSRSDGSRAGEEGSYRLKGIAVAFCGMMCKSFSEFTKYVGAHFRDNHASPPFDMRIWRESWDDVEVSNADGDGDEDDDDNDSDDHDDDNDDDSDDDGRGDAHLNDDQHEDDGNGEGGPPGGGDANEPPDYDYDSDHGPQQDEHEHDCFEDYSPMGSDFIDMIDVSSPSNPMLLSDSDRRSRTSSAKDHLKKTSRHLWYRIPLRTSIPGTPTPTPVVVDTANEIGARTFIQDDAGKYARVTEELCSDTHVREYSNSMNEKASLATEFLATIAAWLDHIPASDCIEPCHVSREIGANKVNEKGSSIVDCDFRAKRC